MPITNPLEGKKEIEYRKLCEKYHDYVISAHADSVREGFQELFSNSSRNRRSFILQSNTKGISKLLKRMWVFLKYSKKMQKGMKECFTDLEPYFKVMNEGTWSEPQDFKRPQEELWQEFKEYAGSKWDITKVGFTAVPPQLVFKEKAILFKYALVLLQEMKKCKIDKAPGFEAGAEVMRVYADLGLAANDLARWLRDRGVRCQSNHPMGGLVLTPPLAGKAGLGWQGLSGILITKEFGARQRIAPIFVENQVFPLTDSEEHTWIEEYCDTCRLCVKECPPGAIHGERTHSIENVEGIGAVRTCIDREKCFPFFLQTMGCSVCLKVCPFSAGAYDLLKASI